MSSADTSSIHYVAMKAATLNKDLSNIASTDLNVEDTDSIIIQKDGAGLALKTTVSKLKSATSPAATETEKGIISIATNDEIAEGVVNDKAIVPSTLKVVSEDLQKQITKIIESKGAANGIATLDSNGKVPLSQIDNTITTEVFKVNSEAAMLALSDAKQGDIALRTDINATFILFDNNYSDINSWEKLLNNKTDIGLSNVDNTSDLNKPISTATQTALNLKANQSTTYTKTEVDSSLALKQDILSSVQLDAVNSGITTTKVSSYDSHISNVSNPHNVTKSQLGLSNVDNTSDLNKPISTATQTALNVLSDDITALENENATNVKTVNSIGITEGTHNIVLNALKNPSTLEDSVKVETITSTSDWSNDATLITLQAAQDTNGPTGGKINIKASSSAQSPSIDIKAEGNGEGGHVTVKSIGPESLISLASDATIELSATYLQINGEVSGTAISSAISSSSTSATLPTSKAVYDIVNTKQNTLIAGSNIVISDNTISATDTTYNNATESESGLMSATDKSKLDSIESGAQVNTVTSVSGKTGAVTLDKTDIGLSNVDNTSDLNKPISTATQTALNLKANQSDLETLSSNVTTGLAAKQDKLSYYSENTEDHTGEISMSYSTSSNSYTANALKYTLNDDHGGAGLPASDISVGDGNYYTSLTIGKNCSGTDVSIGDGNDNTQFTVRNREDVTFKVTSYSSGGSITLNGSLEGAAIETSITSSASNTKIPTTLATYNALNLKANQSTTYTKTEVDSSLALKQDITDNTLNTTAKTIVGAINEVRAGYVVTSTVSSTITPTNSQTGVAISTSTNSGRVIVNPNINNVGAVYLLEGTTYNNSNPIYPDPTNNTYIFSNLSNTYLFVDTVGDSAGITIEIFG